MRFCLVRQLITDQPELSRCALRKLCELWEWKQANGALRAMVCRGLLLLLDRAGENKLPPPQRPSQNRPEGWDNKFMSGWSTA
jgi:hypothetical protein